MARILIFSDDGEVFNLLGCLLQREGHQVRVMEKSAAKLSRVKSIDPDLVMIDSASPEIATASLCREIRSHRALNQVRLVIFSGRAITSSNQFIRRVVDSHMTRPIKPEEVLRRVKALVDAQPEQAVETGGIVIDPVHCTVTRSGSTISLTLLEFRLLYFLASHPNDVCRRDQLLAICDDSNVTSCTIDVLIRNLRKKLGMEPAGAAGIQCVYGLGYVWKTG